MDEFASHTPEAKAGILFIRSLSDSAVLAAAEDEDSPAYASIKAGMPNGTNPWWITAQAATEAYDRGLIDCEEFDSLCD